MFLPCFLARLLSQIIQGGGITLTFDTASLLGSRNISLPESGSGNTIYLVTSVRGDHTESQTAKLVLNAAPSSLTVSFDSVKVGAKVYIESNVYEPYGDEYLESNVYEPYGDKYLHIFTGKSNTFLVSNGTNEVKISMTDMTAHDSDWTPAPSADMLSAGNSIYGYFKAYSNGKYKLTNSNYDIVYSEGTWRGSTSTGGTFYYTEHIYRSFDGESMGSNYVIVEYPEEKSTVIETTAGTTKMTFSSGNGLTYKSFSP